MFEDKKKQWLLSLFFQIRKEESQDIVETNFFSGKEGGIGLNLRVSVYLHEAKLLTS